MKLIDKQKQDIYNEKIVVELTVGELLMLKIMSGETNSDTISSVLKRDTKHIDFGKEVLSKSMNTSLYNSLIAIFDEVTK